MGYYKEMIDVLPILNNKEADTRLIFHIWMSNEAVSVITKDTYVFLLLIYALGQLECSLQP